MSVPKVLVVGAVQGHIEKAFQKISKLQAKQNFSFAIIVGDLFSSNSSDQSDTEIKALLDGNIKVSLPTYFTLGDNALPSSIQERLESKGEICPNLIYLGRKGTLKTTEGIRIVNLGGLLVQNEASITQGIGQYDPLYLESEVKSLHGAHSAHILLTNQWPSDITSKSQIPIPEVIDRSNESQSISTLCLTLKPRYHFSSSPAASWTREPFIMPPSYEGRKLTSYEDLDGPAVTRFSSLASVETSNKEWMSAFSLDPSKPAATEGAQQTCPLVYPASKRKRHETEETNGYSRYGKNNDNTHPSRRNNKKSRHAYDQSPASCFMCTGTPDFNQGMVVSIAEESILTVLKGPLPHRGTTFPQLKSSGHIMIIPMFHAADEASTGKRTLEDLTKEFTEMTKYRHALYKFLSSKSLGAVCWEVNRTGIRHMHWQVIACPVETIQSGLVEAAYKVAAEKASYPPFQSTNPNEIISSQRSDFFRVWIWSPSSPSSTSKKESPADQAQRIANGEEESQQDQQAMAGTETSLYFPISPNLKFNIGFGREVMAGLLQMEDRSRWQDCESGGGIEEDDARAWMEEFGPFDWAMVAE